MYENYPIAHVPTAERFDYFQGLVDELFCPMECDADVATAPFQASLAAADLGELRLACVSTTAVRVRRRRRDIARISDAPYLVKFQMSGEALWSQRGNDVHLRPGDFVICSTAEPYSLEFDGPYKMPVLAVAETTMRHLTPSPDQFLGTRMPGEDACCSLLSSFVADVLEKLPKLPAPMAQRIETNILDLLGGVLAARSAHAGTERQCATALLEHMKGFVRENLRNRRLGPAMLGSAFGVSTRYVHKLFATESITLTRFVRALRLEACRKMLDDPETSTMSITDIALHWGFYDLSHMTRSFREAYGVAPREYRLKGAPVGRT